MKLQRLLRKVWVLSAMLALMAVFATGISGQNTDSLALESPDSMNVILKQLYSSGMPGNVRVLPDDQRILDLLWRHVNYNDSIGIYGYKVLIYNGRSRTDAIEAEALFLNSYPDKEVPTKVVYPEPPDFKTLVGVFRTKEEAYKLQQQIREVFKFCYLVYVRLEPGELE